MEVTAFRFTAKELKKIHQDHLGFLVASSHCCNEFVCMSTYIIFEQNSDGANEVETAFIKLRSMTVLRFLISKIFEYDKLFHGYRSSLKGTFPKEADRLLDLYKPISKIVGSAKWAGKLRQKVSFHFDADHALAGVESMPDNTKLNFMAGRTRGVTYYNFAENILDKPFVDDVGKGCHKTWLNLAYKFCYELHTEIPKFHAELMIHHFDENGLFQKQDKLEIRDKYCAEKGSYEIPIAVLIP